MRLAALFVGVVLVLKPFPPVAKNERKKGILINSRNIPQRIVEEGSDVLADHVLTRLQLSSITIVLAPIL
jgi:hypothetical protein